MSCIMMQTIQLLAKPPWLRKPPYGWFYKSIYIYVFSNMCASCLTESKCGRVKMKTQIYLAAINNRVQLVYIMVYHGLSLVDCFNKNVPFWIPHMERRLQWQHGKNQSDLGYPTKWLYQLKRGWVNLGYRGKTNICSIQQNDIHDTIVG